MLKYVSDLHLEHISLSNNKVKNIYLNNIYPTNYIALLGDIGNLTNNNLRIFLEQCSKNYDKVLYVPGNHEYWCDKKYNINEIKLKLQSICDKQNIILLDNNTCYIENIKFIGTTLWSKIRDHNIEKNKNNGNYKNIINIDGIPITPHITNIFNDIAIKFIQKEIDTEHTCILLTHYPPIYCEPQNNQYTSHPKYYGKHNYEGYHTNIEHIIDNPIVACLYGHTHYCNKFYRNNILYASNQLGYSKKSNFKLNQCIRLTKYI
jgi:predicted MPP superfamily phosphohydrolase